MANKIFIVIIALVIAIVGSFFYLQQNKNSVPSRETQVKTPHFLDSTPLHNEVYAAQPINVTLNFDFDLASGSKISVRSEDGVEWTAGKVKIEDNNTALKRDLKQGMPDGNYEVRYQACWPDGSCHNGQFSFEINRSKLSEYTDKRGEKETTIEMRQIQFEPSKIIISPGTKVTWVNKEGVAHFVNTETHPEHTYFPQQNSRELKKGDSFSVVFETTGQYSYHCSAHVPQGMAGSILVSN